MPPMPSTRSTRYLPARISPWRTPAASWGSPCVIAPPGWTGAARFGPRINDAGAGEHSQLMGSAGVDVAPLVPTSPGLDERENDTAAESHTPAEREVHGSAARSSERLYTAPTRPVTKREGRSLDTLRPTLLSTPGTCRYARVRRASIP